MGSPYLSAGVSAADALWKPEYAGGIMKPFDAQQPQVIRAIVGVLPCCEIWVSVVDIRSSVCMRSHGLMECAQPLQAIDF